MFTTEGVTCSATTINGFSGGAASFAPDPAGAENPLGTCHAGAPPGLVRASWM